MEAASPSLGSPPYQKIKSNGKLNGSSSSSSHDSDDRKSSADLSSSPRRSSPLNYIKSSGQLDGSCSPISHENSGISTELATSVRGTPANIKLNACSSSSYEEMNTRDHERESEAKTLWGDLPEELLEPILARLDLPSLYRMRSVSKKWNSILRDPIVLGTAAPGPPFCITWDSREDCHVFSIFNPALKKWNTWSFASLFSPPLCPEIHSHGFYLLAATGGLLLLQTRPGVQEGTWNVPLFLVNPMNKTYQRLPEPLVFPPFFGFIRGGGRGGISTRMLFKVLAMGVERRGPKYTHMILARANNGLLQEYDSRKGAWELLQTSRDQALSAGINNALSSWIYHKGHWYFIPFSGARNNACREPTPKTISRIGPGVQEIVCETPPCQVGFDWLLDMPCGHIMFIGGTVVAHDVIEPRFWPSGFRKLESLRVWQLKMDGGRAEWTEVAKMPDELVQCFTATYAIICNADGNYIEIVFKVIDLQSVGCSERIMCDVSNNFWWCIPHDNHDNSNRLRKHTVVPKLDLIL